MDPEVRSVSKSGLFRTVAVCRVGCSSHIWLQGEAFFIVLAKRTISAASLVREHLTPSHSTDVLTFQDRAPFVV